MLRNTTAAASQLLVVAALGLVAALAGTAIAGEATTSKKDKLSKQERKD